MSCALSWLIAAMTWSMSSAVSILAVIAAYRSLDNIYLKKVLTNYVDMCAAGYRVKVVIHTVDVWSDAQFNAEVAPLQQNCYHQFGDTKVPAMEIEIELFGPAVKLELTSKHRQTIRRNIHNYDVFVYQEDDIDFTAAHLEHYIRGTVQLESLAKAKVKSETSNENHDDEESLQVIGFLRYEVIGDQSDKSKDLAINEPDNPTVIRGTSAGTTGSQGGDDRKIDGRIFYKDVPQPSYEKRYLIDMPQQIFSPRCINGVPYISDELNPHQAFWVLSREQILTLNQSSCAFLMQDDVVLRESRGQMVYMSSFSLFKADPRVLQMVGIQEGVSCNVQKVLTVDSFQQSGVHHMRQRYAEAYPIVDLKLVENEMINFAREPLAIQRGDIPPCWLDYVNSFDKKGDIEAIVTID